MNLFKQSLSNLKRNIEIIFQPYYSLARKEIAINCSNHQTVQNIEIS